MHTTTAIVKPGLIPPFAGIDHGENARRNVGKNRELSCSLRTDPDVFLNGKMDRRRRLRCSRVTKASPEVAKATRRPSLHQQYVDQSRDDGSTPSNVSAYVCGSDAAMNGTTPPVIHRVTSLDLPVESWSWPFAAARRAEIDAHFAQAQRDNPQLWNGRVLLGRHPVFAGSHLTAGYFETDFASFLAWRDWGFPTGTCSTALGLSRCAAPTRVRSLERASNTSTPADLFSVRTPDLDDVVMAAEISAAWRATRGRNRPCAGYYAAIRIGIALHSPALAMIRCCRRYVGRHRAAGSSLSLAAIADGRDSLCRGTVDLTSRCRAFDGVLRLILRSDPLQAWPFAFCPAFLTAVRFGDCPR